MEPIELAPEELPVTRWRYRALAVGLAVVLVGGLAAVLLAPGGGDTPAQALREIRRFVSEQRTATVTGESTTWLQEEGGPEPVTTRLSGQIRLPDEAHIVSEEDGYADETLVAGGSVYGRSAGGKEELAGEKWERRGPASDDGDDGDDDARLVAAMSAGIPLDLDALFGRLSDARRVGPAQMRGTVSLGDLLPDEVRRLMEAQSPAFDEDELEGTDLPERGITATDEYTVEFGFHVELVITIGYGPGGRLDSLLIEAEDASDPEDATKDRDEFHFSNWGAPVDIAPPAADQVDLTPGIEEEALAEFQRHATVMALSPPPAGWALAFASVVERDDVNRRCPSAELQYFSDDDQPGAPGGILVSTIAPGCPWRDGRLPSNQPPARTVRVGAFQAQVTDDGDGLTAVLTVDGATVVVSSGLAEAAFLDALRGLAPLDLSRLPLRR